MTLLERDHSITQLGAWYRSAQDTAGCVVLVSGEAGIGKTSLLQSFTAHHPAARVLWGACDALITPQPLAPLLDIARQSSGPLSRMFQSGAGREAIFGAALDELSQPGTLAVFEDMHWADEASLDLLKFLGRRIQRTQSMIVVTYRDDEVGLQHPLRLVFGDLPRAALHRISLTPLSEAAVEAMAQAAGRPARGIFGLTGGNPLFVGEVLASDAGVVPATVRDSVVARAARLTPAARALAELVAVVPGKAERWLLEQSGRLDEPALDACLAIGLLRDEGEALSFRHELMRLALQDSIPSGRLQNLHGEVLALLSARPGVGAARLVHHAGGAHRIPEVLRLAPLAAAQAIELGAHREAASHFRTALRHANGLPAEERARLHERCAYECYLTDQMEPAIEDRLAALHLWRACGSRLREGDTLRWLSRLSWFAGRRAPAEQYAAEAVRVLEALPHGNELAMAYSNRAQLDMLAQDTSGAASWARKAIDLAQSLKDPEVLCHALNNLGTSLVGAGDESGWPELERSLQIALDHGYEEHVARAYTNLSAMAVVWRRYAHADRFLSTGIGYCQEHDLESWRLYMSAWSARSRFEQGDWDAAGQAADEVLRHPRTAPVSRVPALIALAHVRIRRGDPDALSPLRQARELSGPIAELQRSAPLALASAEAAWLAGDLDTARRELMPVFEAALARPDAWTEGALAAALWRVDALPVVPGGIAPPYALEIAGRWREAADAWQVIGCPYERAIVLGWQGDEPAQREALQVFEQLGAQPAAGALRRQLRSRGVRRVPRGARSSTQQHPHGLTRREAQILALMGEGLRNAAIAKKLFLSTRTVDHHVSSILTKLGVESRAEAVRFVVGQAKPSA